MEMTIEQLREALDEAYALIEKNALTLRKHSAQRKKHKALRDAARHVLAQRFATSLQLRALYKLEDALK